MLVVPVADIDFGRLPGPPPPEGSWGSQLERYREAMAEVAARTGAPLVDLPAAFEKSGISRRIALQDSVHPTARGNRFIAKVLREAMDQRGLAGALKEGVDVMFLEERLK